MKTYKEMEKDCEVKKLPVLAESLHKYLDLSEPSFIETPISSLDMEYYFLRRGFERSAQSTLGCNDCVGTKQGKF